MNITCPECHNTNTDIEWNRMTEGLCNGIEVPIKEGYGRMNWLYHCPDCFKPSNGRRIKEFQTTVKNENKI